MTAFGKADATDIAAAAALVNNLFKGNATFIAEWATASHVERQGSRKAEPAPGSTTPAPKP